MFMEPILCEPTYISPVWGGEALAEARGLEHTPEHNCGEIFDLSAHPGIVTPVANGPFAGQLLSDVLAAHHDEIIGNVDDDAVIHIILMDSRDTLSVQVHPDDGYAMAHEGDHGKAESWYILEADPGAHLIAGSLTDDMDALRAAAADDTIGPRYGRSVEMQAGDFIHIPYGTLHAMGAGMRSIEISSPGFTTYRLCDWGRGRELHVEKGFDVLKTGNECPVTHHGLHDAEAAGVTRTVGAADEFYTAYVVDIESEWTCSLDGVYQIVVCVGGEAVVETADGAVELPYTRSCLVPACAGSYTVRGNCRIIQAVRNV